MLSCSRVDLEAREYLGDMERGINLRSKFMTYRKRNKCISKKRKVALIVMEDVHTCCLGD